MDLFEKQKKIESINGIIKIRWFIISIIVGLGFVLKLRYFGWATGFQEGFLKLFVFGCLAFGYNFFLWFFMRWQMKKPLELISEKILSIIAFIQIILDQFMVSLVYYNTGTVDGMSFVFYFIAVFLASSLYKTTGIILTGLLAGFLYTTILIIEYLGFIPHYQTYQDVTLFGSIYVLRGKIVSFIFYIGVMTFAAAFLSQVIHSREERLQKQAEFLTLQTKELIKIKNELQLALQKSEISKKAALRAREEMEKANLELKKKIEELEKFYKITVGREVKMVELKERIKELEEKIKKNEKKSC